MEGQDGKGGEVAPLKHYPRLLSIPLIGSSKMPDKPRTGTPASPMEEARELMAQGRSRKALALALNALFHALNNLLDSLIALRRNLGRVKQLPPPSPAPQEERPQPGHCLRPEKKPPTLH
jgi:hypothetical protein